MAKLIRTITLEGTSKIFGHKKTKTVNIEIIRCL